MTNRMPTPFQALEDVTDLVVEVLTELLNSVFIKAPPGALYSFVQRSLPSLREINLPTPLGSVTTPEIGLPEISVLALDTRKREALKATLAIDFSGAIALFPGVGDAIADVIEDTYGAKLRGILTDREMGDYTKFDKLGPSTVALARVFMLESVRR